MKPLDKDKTEKAETKEEEKPVEAAPVVEEAAAVVKRIFDLCINGKGPMQIAKILKADNVLIAKSVLRKEKGESTPR